MKVLGLIPARAGSERIPRKNTIDLGGKPLIQWTIDAAKRSSIFDQIVISTDDDAVIDIGIKSGCVVMRRPARLAHPETPMLPVVNYVVDQVKPEIVVLLQPTSPFRTVSDIENCYDMLISRNADSVVSMTDAPEDIIFELGHADRARPAAKLVVPNGAVYVVTADELARRGNWYSGIMYAYMMPKERSIDVDTNWDLEMARYMLEQGQIKAA